MNELKLMALKAKTRLINKGIRDIYNNVNATNKERQKVFFDIKPSIEIMNENERKRQILQNIKNRISY